MEHFAIIQALCRSALAAGTPAVRRQVERLKEALTAEGSENQASSIAGLLSVAERTKDIAPSRLSSSRGFAGGEVLTPSTPGPVDRETGAPLAEIMFPQSIASDAPVFPAVIANAIDSLVDEWKHAARLAKVGVSPARTCLIFGPPGAGKTRLALWIAQRTGLPIVSARIDGLVSSFLGTTARNIAALFSFANRYRCILLLDEFDAIAKLRDDPHEVGEIKRVVNTLLQNLDGRQQAGLTIGITNHALLLDPAVWRRFEVQLEVPRPDYETRLQIARHYIAPMAPPDSLLKLIAWVTDKATGAEVEAACRAYKKAVAIDSPAKQPVAIFRQFAVLNVGRVSEERKDQLLMPDDQLAATWQRDSEAKFSTREIGEITGVHKSTISRRNKASRRPS